MKFVGLISFALKRDQFGLPELSPAQTAFLCAPDYGSHNLIRFIYRFSYCFLIAYFAVFLIWTLVSVAFPIGLVVGLFLAAVYIILLVPFYAKELEKNRFSQTI